MTGGVVRYIPQLALVPAQRSFPAFRGGAHFGVFPMFGFHFVRWRVCFYCALLTAWVSVQSSGAFQQAPGPPLSPAEERQAFVSRLLLIAGCFLLALLVYS